MDWCVQKKNKELKRRRFPENLISKPRKHNRKRASLVTALLTIRKGRDVPCSGWCCSPSSDGPRPLSVFDPSMEQPDELSSSGPGVVTRCNNWWTYKHKNKTHSVCVLGVVPKEKHGFSFQTANLDGPHFVLAKQSNASRNWRKKTMKGKILFSWSQFRNPHIVTILSQGRVVTIVKNHPASFPTLLHLSPHLCAIFDHWTQRSFDLGQSCHF